MVRPGIDLQVDDLDLEVVIQDLDLEVQVVVQVLVFHPPGNPGSTYKYAQLPNVCILVRGTGVAGGVEHLLGVHRRLYGAALRR